MKRKILYIIIITFNYMFSQLSIDSNRIFDLNKIIPLISMPQLNINKIKEDITSIKKRNAPYKFGHSFETNINFFEQANYEFLDNGDKIYRLKFYSYGAYSINFIFNEFNIPEGSELFIYNDDASHQIGAFTHLNNKNHGRFSTAPVKGETIIIEYLHPFGLVDEPLINIEKIIHGYENIFFNDRGYNDSQECHTNVNCAEAQAWSDEKKSVVMTLTDGGTRLCSGTMVNNTNEDLELYFLTSQTCLGGHEDWIFMFNYESSNCFNSNGSTDQTLSGATLLSTNSTSDFALLKLEEAPPDYYNIYFSGWDARDIIPTNCVSIHHPVGDIKKISFHQGFAISDGWYSNDNTHWRIDEWTEGITEPGSYGGPLFNEYYHIVGQLHGGESSCDDPINDYFGKFSQSWDLGLSEWLDPDQTGILVLNGTSLNDEPDPYLSISNELLNFLVFDNEIEEQNLIISNNGEENSLLTYNFYHSPFSKVNSDPDEGNYYWIDSDASNEYQYYWEDITDFGNPVWFEDNDQSSGPYDIGFNFSFYGQQYSQFIVSPNGWIGFSDNNSEWNNIAIPSTEAPLASILAFWDDLNPLNSSSSTGMYGDVKYYSDNNKLIVSFNDIVRWDSDETISFQIILHKDGSIDINYNTLNGELDSATIGIQNANGEIAQQIAFNNDYLSSSLRLSFDFAPEWLTINNETFIYNELNSQETANHLIKVDGSLMSDGNYTAYLHIESNATGPTSIPIYIQVGYEAEIGDINYDGMINVQDVVLLINMILGSYPANPEGDFNQDSYINVLDAVLLIDYILSL